MLLLYNSILFPLFVILLLYMLYLINPKIHYIIIHYIILCLLKRFRNKSSLFLAFSSVMHAFVDGIITNSKRMPGVTSDSFLFIISHNTSVRKPRWYCYHYIPVAKTLVQIQSHLNSYFSLVILTTSFSLTLPPQLFIESKSH